jgi:hypothetical protein
MSSSESSISDNTSIISSETLVSDNTSITSSDTLVSLDSFDNEDLLD